QLLAHRRGLVVGGVVADQDVEVPVVLGLDHRDRAPEPLGTIARGDAHRDQRVTHQPIRSQAARLVRPASRSRNGTVTAAASLAQSIATREGRGAACASADVGVGTMPSGGTEKRAQIRRASSTRSTMSAPQAWNVPAAPRSRSASVATARSAVYV